MGAFAIGSRSRPWWVAGRTDQRTTGDGSKAVLVNSGTGPDIGGLEIEATARQKHVLLGSGIKQLKEKNIIDDRLYDWSQHLQALRNLAVHPDDAAN